MENVGLSTQQSDLLSGVLENAAAILTVLGGGPGGPADTEPPAPCVIEFIEGTRMQVRIAQPVAPDSPLRVESMDSLWLGAAEACVGVPNDYILTLRLSHFLRNLPELARLAERFRGRAARPEPVTGAIDWNS